MPVEPFPLLLVAMPAGLALLLSAQIRARRFFRVAFLLPLVLLAMARETAPLHLCVMAFVLQYAGLLVERWYFFIEAEHPQNVYYQMIS